MTVQSMDSQKRSDLKALALYMLLCAQIKKKKLDINVKDLLLF